MQDGYWMGPVHTDHVQQQKKVIRTAQQDLLGSCAAGRITNIPIPGSTKQSCNYGDFAFQLQQGPAVGLREVFGPSWVKILTKRHCAGNVSCVDLSIDIVRSCSGNGWKQGQQALTLEKGECVHLLDLEHAFQKSIETELRTQRGEAGGQY